MTAFGQFRDYCSAIQPLLVQFDDRARLRCAAVQISHCELARRRPSKRGISESARPTGTGKRATRRGPTASAHTRTHDLIPLSEPVTPGSARHHQYALRLRITSKNVLIRIWKSSNRLQLLMYQRSSLTRRAISSTEGVPPREPLHCAHPVRPGFT
jgi:hypothetical protein